MRIDIKAIETELDQLVNGNESEQLKRKARLIKIKARLDTAMEVGSRVDYRDRRYDYIVSLNPKRIHTNSQLETHLAICRQAVTE